MAGYGDDVGFNAWLSDNGYELTSDAPTVAVLRQRGSTYIDATYAARFVGRPTGGVAQERQWPRTDASTLWTDIGPDVIPAAVVEASYQAAWYEANNSGGLVAGGSAASGVKREKVGSIEVEYQASSSSDSFAASLTPLISTVDGLLAPYLRGAYSCPAILVV
ncbi:MAG: hypothetical protein QM647_15115 [Asticcacaulis sp.]|uniref:DnaT-like ssDNA-binding protein n=1 Tax=Asticcacaulis sp. TaxID=1872648 RepID=UPI0039E62D6C